MRQYIHEELTRLVGSHYNISPMERLMYASHEPDRIREEAIKNAKQYSFSNTLSWFVNHTARARKLALKCVNTADGDDWVQRLGWAYHFIVDYATTYHSFSSKSNPMPTLIKTGVDAGRKLSSNKTAVSMMVGAGVMSIAGGVIWKKKHNEFEKMCDVRWEWLDKNRVYAEFNAQRPTVPNGSIKHLNNKMLKLHKFTNTLSTQWLYDCTQEEFKEYMFKIANVMDYATHLVITRKDKR